MKSQNLKEIDIYPFFTSAFPRFWRFGAGERMLGVLVGVCKRLEIS